MACTTPGMDRLQSTGEQEAGLGNLVDPSPLIRDPERDVTGLVPELLTAELGEGCFLPRKGAQL